MSVRLSGMMSGGGGGLVSANGGTCKANTASIVVVLIPNYDLITLQVYIVLDMFFHAFISF